MRGVTDKWMKEVIIFLVGGSAGAAGMVIKKLPWLFLRKNNREDKKE